MKLLSPSKKDPADSHAYHKSKMAISINTPQTAIDSVSQVSDETLPGSVDTSCGKTKKVEVLILSFDENL